MAKDLLVVRVPTDVRNSTARSERVALLLTYRGKFFLDGEKIPKCRMAAGGDKSVSFK